jgi:hypothetical protein
VFATGADPANPALTYRVYQRRFGNALVLYKPLSYSNNATGTLADATATTHALDGVYYPLLADGTLGAPVTSITLRNGEGAILVKAAAVVRSFLVTGFPSPATAGAPDDVTVTAVDASGRPVTGYTGTVHFTSSDAWAVLPDDYTFTSADAGAHTFQVTLETAGSQSLAVTDTSNSSLSGSAAVTVNPAAASLFVVAGFPSPVTAGTAGAFTVTAEDPFGNLATGYTGTVTFSSSDGQAVLPGAYTFTTADNGSHTFSAVLKTAGAQSLTVTDSGSAVSGAQAGVTVLPAAATRLSIAAPASVTADTAFTITVTALDPYGNTAAGYTGTVHFSTSAVQALLPADYTFTTADAGVHAFPAGVRLRGVGTQTLTATDIAIRSITGSTSIQVVPRGGGAGLPPAVSVAPGDPGTFSVTGPAGPAAAPGGGAAAVDRFFASLQDGPGKSSTAGGEWGAPLWAGEWQDAIDDPLLLVRGTRRRDDGGRG